eukprot:8045543-Pyramimonas_sp.AAC.1
MLLAMRATMTTTTTTATTTTTTTPAGQHMAFFHASTCQGARWRTASAALLSQGRPKLIREKMVGKASQMSLAGGLAEALP